MTDTLYLALTAYPVPNGTQQPPLTAGVWLASNFLNPPVGRTSPPGGPEGSGLVSGNLVNITGLDNTLGYFLLVYNPQGYQHWFQVQWIGNSSDNPFAASVPYYEGVINPLAQVIGPVVQWGSSD